MPLAAGRRSSGCSLAHERELARTGYRCVAGIDEAGRGALFGPVVVAAVTLNTRPHPAIDDSKRLAPPVRRDLALWIMRNARFAVASASREEIDHLNIRRATFVAMQRAIRLLDPPPDFVLVDGDPIPGLDLPQRAIIKGDGISFSIAAASIIAKVQRDCLIGLYDDRFPCYNLAKNKGYGTLAHIDAINRHGLTRHHRRSFCRWVDERQLSLTFG